jgi:hypothetical protein
MQALLLPAQLRGNEPVTVLLEQYEPLPIAVPVPVSAKLKDVVNFASPI